MARILLNYVLPLILPMVLYLGWMWAVRHRSKARGDEIPTIKRAGIFWSIVAGFALMWAGLAYVAINSGAPPGEGTYQSPRLEDGKIVPPKFN